MHEVLKDAAARERFRDDWRNNFAVSANAGSGKTTAISERLASMALSPEGSKFLSRTAVVTYTKKAAVQIGQKARQVLLRRLEEEGSSNLSPLDHLERAFFGTIHSFCLLLAQRYGQPHGLNLNPRLLAEDEEGEAVFWEEFAEQDGMAFASLTEAEVDAFLRFVPLEDLFSAARQMNAHVAAQLLRRKPASPLPAPSAAAFDALMAVPVKGTGARNIEKTKAAAQLWKKQYESGRGFLDLFEPATTAKAVVESAEAWMAPLKAWLAGTAAVMAAELSERYRSYRSERGVQTYADQIDAALSVLQNTDTLERIRADGWRVVLDEAQDTDSSQFSVLVEIARPTGAVPGTWPAGGGEPPRPGHFCMVGDGQQAIYGARADVRNFQRHLKAFDEGNGGELLVFQVTFRAPRSVVDLLNRSLPAAFGPDCEHNRGLPSAEGVEPPLLQVRYEPLEYAPRSEDGRVECFPLVFPAQPPRGADGWLAEEARQIAAYLKAAGPEAIGAKEWSEVCVLAPRNSWLKIYRAEFEKAGLKTALQIRRNRSGDNPAYAWLAGLLAVICDPDNAFEWFGVLREIFAVSDALLATELREKGSYQWEEPERHPEPLRTALTTVRPWILRVDDEGYPLGMFAEGLVDACGLRAKADAIDAGGSVREELERLIATAATLGLEGGGPRAWFRMLVDEIERKRAGGRAQSDAVNLLSSHSAKGLEWPVVITAGMWRPIGEDSQSGLCVIADATATTGYRAFLSRTHMPSETKLARERERLRELVRLLYVTLTRSRRRLLLPWHPTFGKERSGKPGFAELWGAAEVLATLPAVSAEAMVRAIAPAGEDARATAEAPTVPMIAEPEVLPRRVLPHQLARKEDRIRAARHETTIDESRSYRFEAGDEAIDYGVWWHETMEFTPWLKDEVDIAAHWEARLVEAEAQGFATRARAELERLKTSEAWSELRSKRWTLAPELAVFSPLENEAWIDGVIDLAMHDAASGRLWIVDWKTNHRRSVESEKDFMARLAAEYAPQLEAYGRSLRAILPPCSVRLLLYSSFAGVWTEINCSA